MPSEAPVEGMGKRVRDYGAIFVTTVIFALLAIGIGIAAWWKETQIFNGLMETVKALAMVAAGFWIGSSNQKEKQEDTQAALVKTTAALATAAPASPVVTTTTQAPVGTTTTTTAPAGEPP